MMADQKKIETLLKTARGQIDGILTMVDENRYCIDISTQLMAVGAILRRANKEILSAHLTNCVKTAKTDDDMEEKLQELTAILGKLL